MSGRRRAIRHTARLVGSDKALMLASKSAANPPDPGDPVGAVRTVCAKALKPFAELRAMPDGTLVQPLTHHICRRRAQRSIPR